MQKWVMLIAVCLLNLGLFFGTAAMALADSNQASGSSAKGYSIIRGAVVIDNTRPEDMKRHWVFISCDHWAGCYMRCIGKLKACEKLAETVSWKEIYLFSDKAGPKSPKPVKK